MKRCPTGRHSGGTQLNAALETVEEVACGNASGAVRVTPVPPAPAVPTLSTIAGSSVVPVPMLILRPGARLTFAPVTAATLMFVAPTTEAADMVVAIGRM